MANEPASVNVSESTQPKLKRLIDDGYFTDMSDAYRFAVGLAAAQGVKPPTITNTRPFVATGGLDPDGKLRTAIKALYAEEIGDGSVYRFIERLADWGINEMARQAEYGEINFLDLLRQADR